jgi:hypothetical protein
LAGHMLTVRLSPAPDRAAALQRHLGGVLSELPQRAGLTGSHLLQTQTPKLESTTEQKIRGGADRVADWIVLASGYDMTALRELMQGELSASALAAAGAQAGQTAALYRLSYAMTASDLGS